MVSILKINYFKFIFQHSTLSANLIKSIFIFKNNIKQQQQTLRQVTTGNNKDGSRWSLTHLPWVKLWYVTCIQDLRLQVMRGSKAPFLHNHSHAIRPVKQLRIRVQA